MYHRVGEGGGRVRVKVRVQVTVRIKGAFMSNELVTEWHGTSYFRCTIHCGASSLCLHLQMRAC